MSNHDTATEYMLTAAEIAILEGGFKLCDIERDIALYSGFPSRHVHHRGNREAVARLLEDLRGIGRPPLVPRKRTFALTKGGPRYANVEARLHGVKSSQVIIVAAHLDCSADRDPSYRPAVDHAPGADDDASGIAGVLAAARAIVELSAEWPPAAPRAEIRFVLFNAEEQAQRGSRAYAKHESLKNTKISAVYQMDMIGHRKSDENTAFELHAGNPKEAIRRRSLAVAHHMDEVCRTMINLPFDAEVYPSSDDGEDPGQEFSDHASFHKYDFPAVLVTENFFEGPNPASSPAYPNPGYHLPEDTPDKVNASYVAAIARGVAAAAWHRATRIAVGAAGGSAAEPAHHSGHSKLGAGATDGDAGNGHGSGAGGAGDHG